MIKIIEDEDVGDLEDEINALILKGWVFQSLSVTNYESKDMDGYSTLCFLYTAVLNKLSK